MEKEQVRELIAHYRNLFNQLWNSFLLVSGGIAGLLFKWESPTAKALIGIGVFVWLAFLFSALYANVQAKRLIRRL